MELYHYGILGQKAEEWVYNALIDLMHEQHK